MEKRIKREYDLVTRPLLGKILLFSIPLILTSMLQLLYNAADLIVVGQFAGDEAESSMAAVSSTSSLVNLVTNLFIGFSTGALAVMAKWVGAKNETQADRVTHTSVLIGFIGGCIVGVVGFFLSETLLKAMQTPDDVLGKSTMYLEIFFCGMPFNLLYNFGSSILRACGDTKRPLLILSAAGVVNIALNLLFVAVFQMDVAGVAIATTISQFLSAVLVLFVLKKRKGYGHLDFKRIRLYKSALKDITTIGLPAGIQSTIFSFSNTLIQSSINEFGSTAMAGSGAAASIENFVYVSMNSVAQACLTFVGQNYGAHKKENLNLALFQCAAIATVFGLVLGIGAYLGADGLLYLYNKNPAVIEYGRERLAIVATTYFLCGLMEVLAASLRGVGRSVLPMITSIVGVCGGRILWIYTAFAAESDLTMLYLSYPVSWLFTVLGHFICWILVKKRVNRQMTPAVPAAEPVCPAPALAAMETAATETTEGEGQPAGPLNTAEPPETARTE